MSTEKTEIETFFGRCRCCLSYGYLKNMWEEHHFKGESEIYGEMLVQCFALTWDQSEDAMEQDQICEQCISRLRDANEFKKVVLDSQDELLLQIDAENMQTVKDEGSIEEDYLIDYKGLESEADTMYADTECTMDTADNVASVKDETEYEEVEYLEDEEAGGTREELEGDALDSESSLLSEPKPVKRRKQPRQPDTDEEDGPKRKWPKKLPKSERQKTYKQYSEGDLRKCLEEVRNNVLTAGDAASKYNIPKKTICAKIRMEPKDVRTDIRDTTNKARLECVTRSDIEVPTASHDDSDTGTENQEALDTGTENHGELDTDIEILEEEDRVAKKTEGNKHLMLKYKNNLKMILKYSNATLINRYTISGYTCWFCDKRYSPDKLKKHNFKHGDVYDKAIKAKNVADLVMKLDITALKCRLCEEPIESLEELTGHLQEDHGKTMYTEIENHFIPFKFDTKELQCAICDSKFKYFKLLSEHMSGHYSNYKCPECDRVFINKQSMKIHKYRHRKGKYQCPFCPKVFDVYLKMREHNYATHKMFNKKRKCGFCDEKFSSADAVRNHQARTHGFVRYFPRCEACDKTFASEKGLVIHKRTHHLLLRSFKCEICGRRFYSRQEFDWHSVKHCKGKDFRGSNFGTRPATHRSHRAIRKYKCDYCDMSFVHISTWHNHVLLHRRKSKKH